MPGTDTSAPEVSHVSARGLWVLVDEEEFFLPYEQFPWFLNAPIEAVLRVERPAQGRLRWPALDVDLSIASIQDPERFPLVARETQSSYARTDLACSFFRRFGRFEFALKREGYVRERRGGEGLVVEWRRFAQDHEEMFQMDDDFRSRVMRIVDHPPAEEILSEDGWRRESEPSEITLQWLLAMTYRIRNNLFHGGKYPWDPERDPELLRAATEVLERAAMLHSGVERRYRGGV